MSELRLTQKYPWLLPLRKKQKLFFFYTGMLLDGKKYAVEKRDILFPYEMFQAKSLLYNTETGFDMVYQQNKVFNLKLAANTLDKIIIRPGETFSFWKLVKKADKDIPYKDGLIVIDKVLTTAPGGGMCQMSNMLFWLFLHTPLTIVERFGHSLKDFPDPPGNIPVGVDATTLEGWKDLKVRNDTDQTFQIAIEFDDEYLIGKVISDRENEFAYLVKNGEIGYYRECEKIFEETDIIQKKRKILTQETVSSKILYRNRCEIGYQLPIDTIIEDKELGKVI